MKTVRGRRGRPDRVEAQLQALLPQVPVRRVFRTVDGGETWTSSDLDSLVRAFLDRAARDAS